MVIVTGLWTLCCGATFPWYDPVFYNHSLRYPTMQHTYREFFASWQAMQQRFWKNPWLPSYDIDPTLFGKLNPWAEPIIEQAIELQNTWFEKWQEASKASHLTPMGYANSLQEANKSWLKAQSLIWNYWFDLYRSSSTVTAATPTTKQSIKVTGNAAPSVQRAKPEAAKVPQSRQLELETKDDLKQIVGIGPGLEKKLNAEGIVSFQQIATLTKSDIARLEETVIKFPGRIERDHWIGQAKKLSKSSA